MRLDGERGQLDLGGNDKDGDIYIKNQQGVNAIHLDGKNGDIILANGDCAEEFEVVCDAGLSAGMVARLDPSGRLCPTSEPYDTKVLGIIAGAGDLRPGIILDRPPGQSPTPRLPLALIGKVYCWADATEQPISAGNLLTTSSKLGHAMRASDQKRAFGSVIGKALEGLDSGTGLIRVLVSLR
jgi:hypothetical protein